MAALFLSSAILILFAGAIPHPAVESPQSSPVYLKPYSAVPTGHYNVELLKSRLITQEKITWVQVKNSQNGLTGWTPLQNLLTPLHFATKAQLMAKSPVFRKKLDSQPDPQLSNARETLVQVIDVQNQWVEIARGSIRAWTLASYLYPIDKDPGYFYSLKETFLRSQPLTKSAQLRRIPAGQKLTPLKIQPPWVYVRAQNQEGYILIKEILSRMDIADRVKTQDGYVNPRRDLIGEKIYAIHVNPLWLGTGAQRAPVFEFPQASSALEGYVEPWQSLILQDSVEQEWGVSLVRQIGTVWWPIPQERSILRKLVKIPPVNIREIQHNPLFPHLKIAAADGLFRSTDGKLWAPLKGFEGQNPAFTFSADGVLFVEDKISFDNGEHFAPYIHWEELLKKVKLSGSGVPGTLKIQSIQTMNQTSTQIALDLKLGSFRKIKVYSSDRGRTWSVLR